MEYKAENYDPESKGEGGFEMPDAGADVLVKVLPPGGGQYDTRDVTDRSDKAGKPQPDMIVLKTEVRENQKGAGCWINVYIVDSNIGAQIVGRIMDACGIDSTKNQKINAATFGGKVAKVRIKYETFEGKTRPKIAFWHAREKAGASIPDTASTAEDDNLDDLPF